jgi:allantoinase
VAKIKADLVVKNARIFVDGTLVNGGIAVKDGRIISIGDGLFMPEAERTIDALGNMVLPGVIDTHVHIREPSCSERGTFATETAAAANGGVTTILEQPISSPPPSSPEILRRRIDIAQPQCFVDFAFFGAAGSDCPEEIPYIAKAGIIGFKTFLLHPLKGRENEFRSLTMTDDAAIVDGFERVAKTGLTLTVHAENDDMIQRLVQKFKTEGRTGWDAHCASRPPITEVEAIQKLILLAQATGVRLTFAHVSTADGMELCHRARESGQEVHVETCPQYLFLSDEAMLKYGPFAKCNPPLRSAQNRNALWKYIRNGTVDYIGGDHGPFLLSEKKRGMNNIFDCPAGLANIEISLPLMLTAVRDGKLSLARMVDLLSTNAARIFKLKNKGHLIPGYDADFVIVDVKKTFTVDHHEFKTKARDIAIPYDGMRLTGRPVLTAVRGRVIMENGVIDPVNQGWGRLQTPAE